MIQKAPNLKVVKNSSKKDSSKVEVSNTKIKDNIEGIKTEDNDLPF